MHARLQQLFYVSRACASSFACGAWRATWQHRPHWRMLRHACMGASHENPMAFEGKSNVRRNLCLSESDRKGFSPDVWNACDFHRNENITGPMFHPARQFTPPEYYSLRKKSVCVLRFAMSPVHKTPLKPWALGLGPDKVFLALAPV